MSSTRVNAIVVAGVALLLVAAKGGGLAPQADQAKSLWASSPMIGATAHVTEIESGVQLTARVDTGARTTSLHCGEGDLQIVDAAASPWDNIAKRARLRIVNAQGQTAWIDTRIVECREVRNAEHAELRYCVRIPLSHDGEELDTLVTLNDRSGMNYRLLLGRNFLEGRYVVDVANQGPGAF